MTDQSDENLKTAVRHKFPSELRNLERLEGIGLRGVVKTRASLLRRIADNRLPRSLNPKERVLVQEFLAFGAKAILCFIWYEHPAARKRIGHDGQCLVSTESLVR